MALLSNINDLFSVDSTGAIQFNKEAGTSGYTLVSAGSSGPPVWTDGYGGNVTGTGTGQKVVKWTGTGTGKETVGDGPITFATNDSTFAGTISSGNITSTATISGLTVIARDNLFVDAGQLYIGADDSSTDNSSVSYTHLTLPTKRIV